MPESRRLSSWSPRADTHRRVKAAGTASRRGGLLCIIMLAALGCQARGLQISQELGPALAQVEQRLEEETRPEAAEPNSLAYRRAVGVEPAREAGPRERVGKRVLTLDECLRLAFAGNNEIKQQREQMFFAGGSKLIANSRFLPAIELVNQFEHVRDFEGPDPSADASLVSATLSQRLLEWGKDNPIDINLRIEQRAALFDYENRVAGIFSSVRRAFRFIKLKEQQIAARQESLRQFEAQAQVRQQRMDAGNLSVKIEVLTAQLNVLNERTRINTLERQRFNRKAELLRLIGLPVGADEVEFTGGGDDFGLVEFEMERMVSLALAQDSELALLETLVAEQGRTLRQLRYEYYPDLGFTGGYQDEHGRTAAELRNQGDTWGLDLITQPGVWDAEGDRRGLGLFAPDVPLGDPDPGWFAGVELRIPISEGRARTGRRIQARAGLSGLRAAAADQRDQVELQVRQGYMSLREQKFQVDLAQENVNIERERFRIQEELRDVGKITDENLETFRRAFFAAQDFLFQQQEVLIDRQEDLRLAIRYFR